MHILGVLDEKMNTDTPYRSLYWFIDSKVPIRVSNHAYYMHSNLFVIGLILTIIGSWNPTAGATKYHDENILVIREPRDRPIDVAKELTHYVEILYRESADIQYNPVHPVISKVAFYPDNSGRPDREWIEIYNPTNVVIDLSDYVVGDADDLISGDDEDMYRSPDEYKLYPNKSIVVAYNATAFYEMYGLYPDFEIIDSTPDVPNLKPYNPNKFTGSWNLDDEGDEVVLALDRDGFLVVIDAVWYGSSNYMKPKTESGAPYDISGIGAGEGLIIGKLVNPKKYKFWDAIKLRDKYVVTNLSNTPAYTIPSLETPEILRIYIVDPDNRFINVSTVKVDGAPEISNDHVNLTELGIGPGVYDISVWFIEETPTRFANRTYVHSAALGVTEATNGEKVYVVSRYGGISSVSYETPEVNLHRIIVLLNAVSGTLNISIPGFWNSTTLKVYVDDVEYTQWVPVGSKLISVKLVQPATNVTLVAKTPSNRPAQTTITLLTDRVRIVVKDPDKRYL